jgi:hypothetical protein
VVSALLNQSPRPDRGVRALDQPRPVWVLCQWSEGVDEPVPAFATHETVELLLCDFWDARTGACREHWMDRRHVLARSIDTNAPRAPHPTAAP